MSGSGLTPPRPLAGTLAAAPVRLSGVRAAAVLLALGVASGVGLEVALAVEGWSQTAWLAPVPLLLAIRRARTPYGAYAAAFVAGTVFWTLHIRWTFPLPGVQLASYAAATGTLGAAFGCLGPLAWLARWVPSGLRWAALAATWVLAEYARLHVGFASTPWGMLAYTQVGETPAAQLASLTGLYGVSFLLVAGASAISESIHAISRRGLDARARWELIAPLLMITAAMTWGALRVEAVAADAPRLRVALVQAGTYFHGTDPPERRRRVLDAYAEQTRQAAGQGVDLVAWPASSVPGSLPFDTGLLRILGQLSRETGTPLLVGSSGQDKLAARRRERPTANSAFLIDPRGEIAGQYDKIQLLPFDEYLPLRGVVPWPRWIPSDGVDARAGDTRSVFEVGAARFGVLICWEVLFPDGFRAAVAPGLDFVVSATNEAFTDDHAAHRQMLAMNRMRAIESGIPVLRVATTGVTAAIDRFGRMTAVVSEPSGETLDAVGYRVAEVELGASRSFYARHGDVFAAACALGVAFVIGQTAIGQMLRRRASRAG